MIYENLNKILVSEKDKVFSLKAYVAFNLGDIYKLFTSMIPDSFLFQALASSILGSSKHLTFLCLRNSFIIAAKFTTDAHPSVRVI